MPNKKVFVSGCYDLLHSGHVEFFKEASSYGDLYVGIGNCILGYANGDIPSPVARKDGYVIFD